MDIFWKFGWNSLHKVEIIDLPSGALKDCGARLNVTPQGCASFFISDLQMVEKTQSKLIPDL